MKIILGLAAFSVAAGLFAAEDLRPPFDKSDYKGTVVVHVNPWFPLDKPGGTDAFGGPNIPWVRFTHDAWKNGMELCSRYGVKAFSVEINEPNAWTGQWRELLDAAAKIDDPEVKVGMFFGFFGSRDRTADDTIKRMKVILGKFREDLKSNPRVLRAGGHPVMVVYTPYKYKLEEWKRIFDALDAEFGRMVYLANFRSLAMARGGSGATAEHFEGELRKFLPVFDGVSNYGSGGIDAQHMCAEVLKRVMKDYPGKIFEGGIHTTYTCHFHMGGSEVHLSREWRDSVDTYFAAEPDSKMLTNLFDHYENSLLYPCYEREDFLLRYFEWMNHKWAGKPFRFAKEPEIVLTNHTTIQLGWENLDFEVMTFPIDSKAKDLTVTLQLCDTSGKVLKEFEPRNVKMDEFRCESYSVPSTDFVGERGIVPRVKYVWQGKEKFSDYNPMTLVSPSLRTYHMYWARSTRNSLRMKKGSENWTMDGVVSGGTLVSKGGQTVFTGHLASIGSCKNGYATIKRDGEDFFRVKGSGFGRQWAFDLASPGGGLHYFNLEIEDDYGRRKGRTLPIWHTDGSRVGDVEMPVKREDGTIATYRIEAARVPYWHYPCDRDSGKLLLDVSGYRHNGAVRYVYQGHLGHTGYNYYHNGSVSAPDEKWRTMFARDADGKGYLSFDGSNDYVIVKGGTAFPGASTYEIEVRPSEIGREMGILGSGNNQICVELLEDGRVRAARRSENEDVGGKPRKGAFVSREVTSKVVLSPGTWTKLQVVYDLKKLVLFVDGVYQSEASSAPISNHEWETHLIIGAKCAWVDRPVEKFKGGIRNIRIYGRNLSPAGFL